MREYQPRSVASGPILPDDLPARLWYQDRTGEDAVRNLMQRSRADDYAVVDLAGHVLFRIKPKVLAQLFPFLHFTLTRRERNTIRAHMRKAPDLRQQDEGEKTEYS